MKDFVNTDSLGSKIYLLIIDLLEEQEGADQEEEGMRRKGRTIVLEYRIKWSLIYIIGNICSMIIAILN